MKSLLQRMRRKVGVEDRNFVEQAYAGLLNQYRTGGNPHAESARSLVLGKVPVGSIRTIRIHAKPVA